MNPPLFDEEGIYNTVFVDEKLRESSSASSSSVTRNSLYQSPQDASFYSSTDLVHSTKPPTNDEIYEQTQDHSIYATTNNGFNPNRPDDDTYDYASIAPATSTTGKDAVVNGDLYESVQLPTASTTGKGAVINGDVYAAVKPTASTTGKGAVVNGDVYAAIKPPASTTGKGAVVNGDVYAAVKPRSIPEEGLYEDTTTFSKNNSQGDYAAVTQKGIISPNGDIYSVVNKPTPPARTNSSLI